MESPQDSNFLEPSCIGKYKFLSKISEILNTSNCSKNLIVAVYLLEQKRFFYCNSAFKKLLGNKLDQFYELGWDFWFSNIWPDESLMVRNRIDDFLAVPFDGKPLTLRYHIYDGTGNSICLKHEIVLHEKNGFVLAVNYLFDVSEKELIEHCLNGSRQQNGSVQNPITKPISPREEEVLKLIADGYSSKQIADRLFISNHTAISHRKHLIEKFKVRNTAQLIKKASKIMQL